jgi:mono/diheme cytochrome c family protein
MIRYALALLALLLLGVESRAGCYAPRPTYGYGPSYRSYSGYRTYSRPSYYDDTPYFLKFAAVIPLVELPTYSTTLAPAVTGFAKTQTVQTVQAPAPVAPAPSADLKEILAVVKQIASRQSDHAARLTALEARLAPTVTPAAPPMPAAVDPAPPVKPASAMALYGQRCAACHLAGKEADGGGFILLLAMDRRAAITGKQLRGLTRHITGGTMPPAGKGTPLNDEEASAILSDLSNFDVK